MTKWKYEMDKSTCNANVKFISQMVMLQFYDTLPLLPIVKADQLDFMVIYLLKNTYYLLVINKCILTGSAPNHSLHAIPMNSNLKMIFFDT